MNELSFPTVQAKPIRAAYAGVVPPKAAGLVSLKTVLGTLFLTPAMDALLDKAMAGQLAPFTDPVWKSPVTISGVIPESGREWKVEVNPLYAAMYRSHQIGGTVGMLPPLSITVRHGMRDSFPDLRSGDLSEGVARTKSIADTVDFVLNVCALQVRLQPGTVDSALALARDGDSFVVADTTQKKKDDAIRASVAVHDLGAWAHAMLPVVPTIGRVKKVELEGDLKLRERPREKRLAPYVAFSNGVLSGDSIVAVATSGHGVFRFKSFEAMVQTALLVSALEETPDLLKDIKAPSAMLTFSLLPGVDAATWLTPMLLKSLMGRVTDEALLANPNVQVRTYYTKGADLVGLRVRGNARNIRELLYFLGGRIAKDTPTVACGDFAVTTDFPRARVLLLKDGKIAAETSVWKTPAPVLAKFLEDKVPALWYAQWKSEIPELNVTAPKE